MSDLLELMNYEDPISSVEASPARTSPQPAREPALKGADLAYFGSYSVSFASWSPDGWSSKTCPLFGNGAAERYSGRWPAGGTILGGAAYPRPGWEPLTGARGGSVSRGWPTPTVAIATGGQTSRGGARKGELLLSGMVRQNWPTMTVSEAERGHGYQRAQGRIYPTLTGATGAAQAWPTPTALNNNRPTGSIQEWGGSGGNKIRHLDPELARGRLNPEWVEMLMGFPAGWTFTDGPPLRDHSTHGSHRAPDHDSHTTGTD